MTKPRPLIGIDIGSTAVRICQLERLNQDYRLVLYDQIDLSQAPVGQKRKSLHVRDAVHELIERNELKHSRAVISPPVAEEFIRGITLRHYRSGFRRSDAAAELFAELPAIPDAMYLQALPRPGGNREDSLVFAAQRDAVHRRIDMLKQLDVEVPIVDASLFALYNLWVKFYRPDAPVRTMIVDIGYRTSRFIVIENEAWSAHGTADAGGRDLTLRLKNVLDLSGDEAESYKVGGSDAGDGGIIPRDVHDVLVEASRTLARAIGQVVQESKIAAVDSVVLTGRSASLNLVRQAIGDACGAPVEIFQPFSHMVVPTEEFAPAFLHRINPEAAVAAGLALRSEDAL